MIILTTPLVQFDDGCMRIEHCAAAIEGEVIMRGYIREGNRQRSFVSARGVLHILPPGASRVGHESLKCRPLCQEGPPGPEFFMQASAHCASVLVGIPDAQGWGS